MTKMKVSILGVTGLCAFICSYFLNLAMNNFEQYMAIAAVIFADGFFGIIAGVKTEGFKTFKALKIIKTFVTWVVLLTIILSVEAAFKGTSWLSETMVLPFLVFELMSILKNASRAGYINNEVLKNILLKIDQHKID